jgi:hypothetical protein
MFSSVSCNNTNIQTILALNRTVEEIMCYGGYLMSRNCYKNQVIWKKILQFICFEDFDASHLSDFPMTPIAYLVQAIPIISWNFQVLDYIIVEFVILPLIQL